MSIADKYLSYIVFTLNAHHESHDVKSNAPMTRSIQCPITKYCYQPCQILMLIFVKRKADAMPLGRETIYGYFINE